MALVGASGHCCPNNNQQLDCRQEMQTSISDAPMRLSAPAQVCGSARSGSSNLLFGNAAALPPGLISAPPLPEPMRQFGLGGGGGGVSDGSARHSSPLSLQPILPARASSVAPSATHAAAESSVSPSSSVPEPSARPAGPASPPPVLSSLGPGAGVGSPFGVTAAGRISSILTWHGTLCYPIVYLVLASSRWLFLILLSYQHV